MLCSLTGQQKLEQTLFCQHLSREPKHTGKLQPKERSILWISISHFHLSWDIVIPHQEDGKSIIHSTQQGAPVLGSARERQSEGVSFHPWLQGNKSSWSFHRGSELIGWYEKGFWSSHTCNPSPCSTLLFKTMNHLLEDIQVYSAVLLSLSLLHQHRWTSQGGSAKEWQ